jgi:hypothetical protein
MVIDNVSFPNVAGVEEASRVRLKGLQVSAGGLAAPLLTKHARLPRLAKASRAQARAHRSRTRLLERVTEFRERRISRHPPPAT